MHEYDRIKFLLGIVQTLKSQTSISSSCCQRKELIPNESDPSPSCTSSIDLSPISSHSSHNLHFTTHSVPSESHSLHDREIPILYSDIHEIPPQDSHADPHAPSPCLPNSTHGPVSPLIEVLSAAQAASLSSLAAERSARALLERISARGPSPHTTLGRTISQDAPPHTPPPSPQPPDIHTPTPRHRAFNPHISASLSPAPPTSPGLLSPPPHVPHPMPQAQAQLAAHSIFSVPHPPISPPPPSPQHNHDHSQQSGGSPSPLQPTPHTHTRHSTRALTHTHKGLRIVRRVRRDLCAFRRHPSPNHQQAMPAPPSRPTPSPSAMPRTPLVPLRPSINHTNTHTPQSASTLPSQPRNQTSPDPRPIPTPPTLQTTTPTTNRSRTRKHQSARRTGGGYASAFRARLQAAQSLPSLKQTPTPTPHTPPTLPHSPAPAPPPSPPAPPTPSPPWAKVQCVPPVEHRIRVDSNPTTSTQQNRSKSTINRRIEETSCTNFMHSRTIKKKPSPRRSRPLESGQKRKQTTGPRRSRFSNPMRNMRNENRPQLRKMHNQIDHSILSSDLKLESEPEKGIVPMSNDNVSLLSIHTLPRCSSSSSDTSSPSPNNSRLLRIKQWLSLRRKGINSSYTLNEICTLPETNNVNATIQSTNKPSNISERTYSSDPSRYHSPHSPQNHFHNKNDKQSKVLSLDRTSTATPMRNDTTPRRSPLVQPDSPPPINFSCPKSETDHMHINHDYQTLHITRTSISSLDQLSPLTASSCSYTYTLGCNQDDLSRQIN